MFKRILLNFTVIAIVTALLLTDLIKFLKFNNVLPDLILILTVFNGFFGGPIFGMVFGFASGLAYDISIEYPIIGLWALIYTIIGFSTSISKLFYIENTFISSVTIFIFMLIKAFLLIILAFLFRNSDYLVNYFSNIYWIQLIYTLLLSIPVFLIYRKFNISVRKSRING